MKAMPGEFFKKYNTYLSPDQEALFRQWAEKNNRVGDMEDYDLRGFYKSGEALAENGHGSDRYKKPNHPTFSDQSQYHGTDGFYGGTWTPTPVDGSYVYEATQTNNNFNPALADYFKRREKESFLIGAN